MESNRLFRGLSADELKQVQSLFAAHEAGTNERLIAEGETNATLYLLDEGKVRFYRKGLGYQPQLLTQLSPGAFFGEVSVLDGKRHSMTRWR